MADQGIFDSVQNGAVFLQLDVGSPPHYLGCHDLDKITNNKGKKEIVQCFKDGEFKTLGSVISAPDTGSTSLTTFLDKTSDWLEQLNCPGTLIINEQGCGKPNLVTNYDRQFILDQFEITSEDFNNLVNRNKGAVAESVFNASYSPTVAKLIRPKLSRTSTAETRAINKVIMFSKECESSCPDICKYGVAATDCLGGSAGSKANVLLTSNYGGSWVAVSGQPFAATEEISSIAIVPMSATAFRIIAVRGTTDAGNPAEIAYSDNYGVTWSYVNVGSTNGQYAIGKHSLYAIDKSHIWLVLTSGGVFFSENGGVTWTQQYTSTVQNLFSIHMYSELYGFIGGASNTLLSTTDGGGVWSTEVAPVAMAAGTINTVWQYDYDSIFIGYSTGYVYLTIDKATSWAAQSFYGAGGGSVGEIKFFKNIGFMVTTDATGVGHAFRTPDTGADWEVFDATNSGLNSIYPCDYNTAYIVGEVNSTTGWVGVLSS
jgi:hypothetical protein